MQPPLGLPCPGAEPRFLLSPELSASASAMNPVNATALYISATRLVLNYGPGEDPQCLAEIGKLLPYFRQSLSCCVCGE